MEVTVSAFEAALSVCWALLVAVVLLKIATRDGASANSTFFVRGGLLVMVTIQFYYLYHAAKLALPQSS